MNEQKMYAVKNDKGEWLSFDPSHESLWHTNNPTFFKDKSYAEAQNTGLDGSRVVELVEKPAPEVVSEEEAEMLERAKSREEYPAKSIHRYVYDSHNFSEWDCDREIRLMRAYVNGWTVEKPKHYVLPMEGTELADGTVAYAALDHTNAWTVKGYAEEQSAITFGSTVTQADIDAAPDWVKTITPVEVTDDEVS